ncbi:MAG TPA: tetratricopeptide repeat protein, partial [Polyangia bacterium]
MRVLAALAILLAIGAGPRGEARADDALDARAHYQAGQHFYDQGQYDEAIREFEEAYRLKPHPNVLY